MAKARIIRELGMKLCHQRWFWF